jgi:hypothetical protein
MEEAAVMEKPNRSKVLDYANVAGQDNISRFGDKLKIKKKQNKRHI